MESWHVLECSRGLDSELIKQLKMQTVMMVLYKIKRLPCLGAKILVKSLQLDSIHNHLVHKRTLNHLAKLVHSFFTMKRVHDMIRRYSQYRSSFRLKIHLLQS